MRSIEQATSVADLIICSTRAAGSQIFSCAVLHILPSPAKSMNIPNSEGADLSSITTSSGSIPALLAIAAGIIQESQHTPPYTFFHALLGLTHV